MTPWRPSKLWTDCWATTGPPTHGWPRHRGHIAGWHGYLDSWKDREAAGRPAYAQVIQIINELCDDNDYCLSAAGGLPGELTMGWRSKAVGTFDSEYGYSTMGYEVAGAWGGQDGPSRYRRDRLRG